MNQDIILKESEANRILPIVLMYLKILLFLGCEFPKRPKLPVFEGLGKLTSGFALTLLNLGGSAPANVLLAQLSTIRRTAGFSEYER
jgi:hypothetical protein